jgi:hypothetical protein
VINPFQITKPVEPGEIIDRDDETRRIVDLAFEGNNARLIAPRRYGKTSLVRRVQAELDKVGWITVYVDLLGILSAEDFTARIERAYTRQLTGAVSRWWVGIRRSLKPSATAGGGALPASVSVDLSGQAEQALIERLDLPTKVYGKTGKRVHVVFDEFQELDRLTQKNVDQILRSVIQHHGDTASYVFAGSELHMMEMMFADSQRAFYGQTQKIELAPLADAALSDYIVRRFDDTNKSVSAEVLDTLLGLVRGHPQRAMAAAHALWRCTENEAGIDDWEEARANLMENVDDELRALWMDRGLAEREALVLVASGRAPYSRASGKARGGSRVKAVEDLKAKGVIAGEGQDTYIVDPLFGDWIRNQHTPPDSAQLDTPR